jgi:D-glycero-alpha-D-manno-heptose-7-phosphate kinase
VGLLHAVYALKGVMQTKMLLATEAIHIEQDIIKENVGSQDQVAAAFGGFNVTRFNPDNTIQINPVILSADKLNRLQNHLMFLFTGFSRIASEIAREQIDNTSKTKMELSVMQQMVDEALTILTSDNTDITEFGKLLNESWQLKRRLTDKISTLHIDEIYEEARREGAIGGKLLGAGGGGFMVIFAKPEDQPRVRERLKRLLMVPFEFETSGSQIIVYQPNGL